MITRSVVFRSAEIVLLTLVVGALNLAFPGNPGFLGLAVNPFVIFCLLVAGYYGRYAGFLALAFSVLLSVVPIPFFLSLLYSKSGVSADGYRSAFTLVATVPLAVTFIAVYVLGLIHDRYQSSLESLRDRTRERIRVNVKQKNLTDALFTVNRELEERVLRQVDTLTTLYAQVQKLNSSSLQGMLEGILETIEGVSGATSCTIWEHRPEEKKLLLAARRGDESKDRIATAVPVEESIEGWVVRNDVTFTVQMLTQYSNLNDFDTGYNIMTFPISAGRRVWGVLNIGAMPFGKYNRYTQRLVEVILALVSPSLEKAVEYEMTVAQAELDVRTGLPLISQFHALLEKEVYRTGLQKGTLSVILLELTNAQEIRDRHGQDGFYALLNNVIDEVQKLSNNRADMFHYRNQNQIAVLYPNLDFDGASLFCLEVLSAVTTHEWTINQTPVSIELIVGYSAIGDKRETADELLRNAEQLLEMQKV